MPSHDHTDPSQAVPLRGCFVAGTDTDVGKTLVTAGMALALRALGLRVAAIKPVAAGMSLHAPSGAWVNGDVAALLEAGSAGLSATEVGPLQLREPCSPHIAARLEGRRIDKAALLASVRQAALKGDLALIEGAGGFLVPIGDSATGMPGQEDFDGGDLAAELGLPLILVVGMRLGCLNHTLLTLEAVRTRGLPLVGWVANHTDPQLLHQDLVFEHLCQHVQAPCLARIPHLAEPSAVAAARHIDAARLRASVAWPARKAT